MLITGAAGAIGSAIAQSMIDHGARVTRTDRVAGEGVILLDACNEASVRRGFEVAGIKSLVSREPLDRQLETFRELFASEGPAFDVTA